MSKIKRVCLVPKSTGVGGPASFRMRFAHTAAELGVEVCHDLDDQPYDAILVIGGTRQIGKLWRAKRSGIPIVQRLDGFNWVHRAVKTSPGYWLRAELRNGVLRVIRRFLADRIVYQSDFVVRNWERTFGAVKAPYDVIRNGIDLDQFTPDGEDQRPTDRCRIMMLEGAYLGGHDFGLKLALDLAAALEDQYGFRMELMVAGKLTDEIIQRWDAYARVPVIWKGIVPRQEIPFLHRSAHLYFPVEINPACPNSVIEALACGLPVAAFETGSLSELVGAEAGRLVPYGGDPWKLEIPDITELAAAAAEVLQNQDHFRAEARAQARNFAIQDVIHRYLAALEQA